MQLIDQAGRPVQLGREIGRGGEGAVFEVVGHADFVAKIYHQPADPLKARKLLCMAAKTSADLTRLAAWPSTVLFDRSRALRGIVMPMMKGAREIHVLYSPAQRRTHFPRADWHFLVRAARNCAASFTILHEADVVVGDVNQGNILVDHQALVRLIDCDSFQLTSPEAIYPCLVGVSHFTPPELQSCRFDQVNRTQNHDNFGLAVIIFHLLFMGRHPFAGRFTGRGEMPTIEAAISQYRFAFGSNANRYQLAPPPGSPTLAMVPSEMATLFERAFAPGSEQLNARPTAADWVAALERLESILLKCGANPGHIFAKSVASCPWCHLDTTSGTHFFISVTLDRLSIAPAIDIDAIWKAITAVPTPEDAVCGNAPNFLGITPRPKPQDLDERQTLINAIGVTAASGLLLSFVALLGGLMALAIAMFVVSFTAAAAWLYVYRDSPQGKEWMRRGAIVREAEYKWRRANTELLGQLEHFASDFDRKRALLHAARKQLGQLEQAKQRKITEMQRQAQARQFAEYLDSFNIADADIPNIGRQRAAMLAYHGIETARDIPDANTLLRIPGVGESLANGLETWRQRLAAQFHYNAAKGLPLVDIQAVSLRFGQERMNLEATLLQGAEELRRISTAAKKELGPFHTRVVALRQELEQARADLRAM